MFLEGPRPVGRPKMGTRRPQDDPRWAQDGRRWRRWAKDLRKFAQEAASERQDAVSEGRESGFEAEKARGISVKVRGGSAEASKKRDATARSSRRLRLLLAEFEDNDLARPATLPRRKGAADRCATRAVFVRAANSDYQ